MGSDIRYTFGPGPITPAVRAIIIACVAMFLLALITPRGLVEGLLGLTPQRVLERGFLWQPATYLFVHSRDGFSHILFNMLAVWMFGVELERRWGTVAFTKYFLVCGLGAAATVIVTPLMPIAGWRTSYVVPTIGASGAVYGILLAWAVLSAVVRDRARAALVVSLLFTMFLSRAEIEEWLLAIDRNPQRWNLVPIVAAVVVVWLLWKAMRA